MIRVVFLLLTTVLLAEIFVIAPLPAALSLVAAAMWMVIPGVVLTRAVFAGREGARMGALLAGPAIGLAFSVFGVFLWWAAGVRNWLAIVLGPLLTLAIAMMARKFGGPRLRLPAFDRRDAAPVLLLLLIVPAITWAPYDHVREPLPEGEAYRAYFTADFVWAMTVTAEIAKGDVPPANPFLRGASLRYYWMSHFLSGALYRNVREWGITIEQVVLIDGLVFGLAAVAFFYALARMMGANPAFAAIAVAIAFLANSYEGANRLWVLSQRGGPLAAVRDYNIDSVTRWFYQGMPVDGLHRMLLYQPHHLTGYMMALAALWLAAIAEDITETSVSLWTGILLSLALLFSTFTPLIVGPAVVLLYAIRLVQQRAFSSLWQCAVLGAAPAAVGVGLTMALGYTDAQGGSLMVFGPNEVALRRWPLMIFLSFGPLMVLGLGGLARVRWVLQAGLAPALLVLSALAFYFFVDVIGQEGVWVGWRSGHLLFISFIAIGASALTVAWQYRAWRVPLGVLTALAVIPAAPTVAIDVYNAQDITNRDPGPGFPWTLILTPAEREGAEWIRRSTPPDAVVQYEPTIRGFTNWGYISAFAERRSAAAYVAAMIPAKPYEMATATVKTGIFQAGSAADAHQIARSMGIDYVLFGTVERRAYRGAFEAFGKQPEYFPIVFRNADVTIFQVASR